MSTTSLRHLEDRLRHEAPAFTWECEPVTTNALLAGTNLPEEIQIRATKEGEPVKGSPVYLSGECLLRWGMDASAAMICNEITLTLHSPQPRSGLDWDRLAEF